MYVIFCQKSVGPTIHFTRLLAHSNLLSYDFTVTHPLLSYENVNVAGGKF